LVSNTTGTNDRISDLAASIPENVEATNVEQIPHCTRSNETSRVGIIKQNLLEEGFSEEVAQWAAQPQRESSLSLYESHYRTFRDWCLTRHIDLESVTIHIIADYFMFMFKILKRQVATICSHRTALSAVLGTFDGHNVGSHPVISNLMRNFWRRRPQARIRNLDWDLLKVLSALIESPFEPPRFDTIEQRQLTSWKTCFLLAFACTKRASEISAFTRDKRDLIFETKGVWLRTIPGFLPKTQAPQIDPKPFLVPAHDSFSGRDNKDRLLCPVCMLKYYLNFTNGYAKDKPLFIKCVGVGAVCSKTISSWLKKTIYYAYRGTTKPLAKGHEVRKTSASWVFASGSQVNDILASGTWKRQSTFTTHYLVDVQRQFNDKHRLKPVNCFSKDN
jgi:hypothetical protein